MKRILVICPFPFDVAAGQRLKYEQYFEQWRASGYEVVVSPFMHGFMWRILYKRGYIALKLLGTSLGYFKRIIDLLRLWRFDAVYVFMWVTPFGGAGFEILARRLSKHMIYDIEDNIIEERPGNINPIAKLIKSKSKTLYLISRSDHVITSSPWLNEKCLNININKRCTYISSSVDIGRFLPRNGVPARKTPTIGWTGTFSTAEHLDELRSVFQRLAKIIDYKLVVIGNFEYSLQGVNLEVIRWNKESEIADLHLIDIGVYPLPDNSWVLGKSGLKAIQYMSCEIPPVASDFGNAKNLITHMEDGILVRTEEEWIEALCTLIRNPDLRHRLGRAARDKVINNYSKEVIGLKYLEVLSDIPEKIK